MSASPMRKLSDSKRSSISSLPPKRANSQIFNKNSLHAIITDIPPPLDLSGKEIKPISIPLDLPPMPIEKIPSDKQLQDLKLPSFVCPSPKDDSTMRDKFQPSSKRASVPVKPGTRPLSTTVEYRTKVETRDNSINPRSLRSQSAYEAQNREENPKNRYKSDPIGFLEIPANQASELARKQEEEQKFTINEEDKEKIKKLHERGDLSKQCIKESQLINGTKHKYLEHLPELVDANFSGEFITYAQQNFKVTKQKKHLQRKQIPVENLISFTKKISTSLHAFESKEIQRMALDLFEKILSYMTDSKKIEKSNTPSESILQSLLDVIVKKPELSNEAYCQVLKQLTNNPRPESSEKGWHILGGLCNFVAPSKVLLPYVSKWVLDMAPFFPNQAWFCLQSLQKTIERKSPRKGGPNKGEIEGIKNAMPNLLRICTFGGIQKAVYVDTDTTISEVIHSFCERVGIPFSQRNNFSLHIFYGDSKIEPLYHTKGYVGDISRIMEDCSFLNAKLCIEQHLFFQRRKPITDFQHCSILFHQLRRDLLLDCIPCSPKKAFALAGLLLQHDSGDYSDDKSFKVPLYLPPSINSSENAEICAKSVTTEYFSNMGTSKEDCMVKFTNTCQTLQYFGCFFVNMDVQNRNEWDMIPTKNVRLAINEDGLQIYTRDLSSTLLSLKISNILRWNLSGLELELSIVGYTNPLKLQSPSQVDSIFFSKMLMGYSTHYLAQTKLARATKDFQAEDDDLLSFKQGDIIHIIHPNPGNGWEFGTLNGNERGNFPLTHVQHIVRHPDDRSPRADNRPVIHSTAPTTFVTDQFPLHEEILPTLLEFASSYFRTKKLQNGFVIDFHKRMTFSNENISHSLLKMDSSENKQAIEMNSLFLKYVTTRKIRTIMEAIGKTEDNNMLRNELYCQCLKHTLGNLSEATSRAAWEWFTMVTLAYNPPNPDLLSIVESYLEMQGINDPDQQVILVARHALLQITRRKENGPRLVLPSTLEYEAIQQGALYIPVKINTLNNNAVSLIDSCSTAEEIVSKIGFETLRLPNVDYFGLRLYKEKGFDIPVHPKAKVVDLISQKDLGSSKVPSQVQLIFGVQVWNFKFPPNMDDNLLSALYELMLQRVRFSSIYCPLNQVLDLASFIIQGSGLKEATKQNLHLLLPKQIIAKSASDSLIQKVNETFSVMQISSMSDREAKLSFLQNATNKNIWSWTFFPLSQKKKVLNVPKKYLALSTTAVGVFKADGETYSCSKKWEWEKINSIESSSSDSPHITIHLKNQTSNSFSTVASVVKSFKIVYENYQQIKAL